MLQNWRTAPISERLRAALDFLEKLTSCPQEIIPDDATALRMVGIPEEAIRDAIYVCAGFNMINRIADALGFNLPSAAVFSRTARFLTIFGYRFLSGIPFENAGHSTVHLPEADPAQKEIKSRRQEGRIDSYASCLERLERAVLHAPGVTEPDLRQTVCFAAEAPDPMGGYVKKVVQCAHAITDGDIAQLRQDGYTDDQLFEVTLSAALGAALVRLEAGLGALNQSVLLLESLESG